MDRSSVVAHVTILRANAKLPDAPVEDLDRVAVARIDRVIDGNGFVMPLAGQKVTVELDRPATAGEELVFFGNAASIGKTVLLAEIGSYRDAAHDADERIAAAHADRDRRSVSSRTSAARWVFVGEVESIGAPVLGTPISEHDPAFTVAVILVGEALKGAPPTRVKVRFAASSDVAWYRAPKLAPHQRGVFIVQPDENVIDPRDVRPESERGVVADVLRCPA